MMKNKDLINLPVIAECTKDSLTLNKGKKSNYTFIASKFYQSSKLICDSFHKPLYLKINNDR